MFILFLFHIISVKAQDCVTGVFTGNCEADNYRTLLSTITDKNLGVCRTIYASEICGSCRTTATLVGSCSDSLRITTFMTASAFNGGAPCTEPTTVAVPCQDCHYIQLPQACDGSRRLVGYDTILPVNGGRSCTERAQMTESCHHCHTHTLTGSCDGTSREFSYQTSGSTLNGGTCVQPTPSTESCQDCKMTSTLGKCVEQSRITNYFFIPPVNGGKMCDEALPADKTEPCRDCSTTFTEFGACRTGSVHVTHYTLEALNGGIECTEAPSITTCKDCATTATVVGDCVSSVRPVMYFVDPAINNGKPCEWPTSTTQDCADCTTKTLVGPCDGSTRVIQFQTIAPVNGGANCLPIEEPIQLQSCKSCGADSNNCCFVVEMWKLFGYQTDLNQDDPYECCFGDIPGIRCFRNKVISINWDSRSLSGAFPTHMGSLTYLRSLKLGNNKLQGPIPKSINNLANLEILELHNNNFEGNISLSLPLLSTLKLSNNANLSGTIDVSNGIFIEHENTKIKETGTKNSQIEYICHVKGSDYGANMDYDSDTL